MNGTTRCPLCDTRFRITEVQLTAHNGMVRCGHCHGAFDARIDFIAEQDPVAQKPQPVDEPPPAAIPDHGPDVQPDASLPQHDSLSDFIVDSNAVEHPIAAPEAAAMHETAAHEADELTTAHEAEELTATPEAEELTTAHVAEELTTAPEVATTAPEALPESETPAPAEVPHIQPALELDADIQHVVSLDDEKPPESTLPPSVGAQPARTLPWLIGIAACVLLLSAQSAYFLRVELAAHLPVLRPALTGICNAIGCKVALPRDMDAISIESSGLDADPEHDNLITLNALLRNRAGTLQAYPMLLLTLNDNRDKLLARRPLNPAEYLPAGESEAAGFAPNHEVSVRLRLDTADLKPSGYRLELFYGRN